MALQTPTVARVQENKRALPSSQFICYEWECKAGRMGGKPENAVRKLNEGKYSQITQESIDLLESIGFEWSLKQFYEEET